MSIRRAGLTGLTARLRRMPSHAFGLLASLALLAASLSAFMLSTQAASAAEPETTHSSLTEKFVGHPPTKTRATSVKDRSDAPQHRAAPWTPLAVEPTATAIGPEHVEIETLDWVHRFNTDRTHESIDDLTPLQAEQFHYTHRTRLPQAS